MKKLFLLLLLTLPAHAADDIVIADFESPTYGAWTITGDAFGTGPASGGLTGQQKVTGFQGHGLVDTFLHGDAAQGTLTSPPFTIQRDYINFFIGGGEKPGREALVLLVDGKPVRQATGNNSEELLPRNWEVQDLAGKTATLEIIDQSDESFGHILVDQIVQSNQRQGITQFADNDGSPYQRDLAIDKQYLLVPIKQGAQTHRLGLFVDGKQVRWEIVQLDDSTPDFWAPLDVSAFKGAKMTLKIDRLPDRLRSVADAIVTSDDMKIGDDPYHEKYRPQFHFTSKQGWLNDPNGLVYYHGTYHLFYQHDPGNILHADGQNVRWGHAVSPDLVHWTELPVAIYPDANGSCWSGSAAVDWNNTSGFQSGPDKPLAAFYTECGQWGQALCYSTDAGKTWNKYAGNPAIAMVHPGNRDPKVIWYEPTKSWILVFYLAGHGPSEHQFALNSSPDLIHWKQEQVITVPGWAECPDFFPLTVEGEKTQKWIFTNANAQYLIGSFDGHTFTPDDMKPQHLNFGHNFYAAQSYSDIPPSDGRRIQIGWMSSGPDMPFPGMPFNEQMSFPNTLTLRRFPDGLRICRQPVKEIDLLHDGEHAWHNLVVAPGDNPLKELTGDLFEIRAEIEPGAATEVGFRLRGLPVSYSTATQTLTVINDRQTLPLVNGRIKLQILLDRTSLEAYANDGYFSFTSRILPPDDNLTLEAYSQGAPARFVSLQVFPIKSAWPSR